MKFKDGARVPKQVAKRLTNISNLTDIPRIDIAGVVNDRKFKMSLIFQIHPLYHFSPAYVEGWDL
jgi:hypothetical protein